MAGRKKKQRPFTKGPICFRKAPYVSERTYMFQKNPICLKKRPICCPYVVLSEGFSSLYVEKAPYVANQVPICGPYAAHMWPICFGCSSGTWSLLPRVQRQRFELSTVPRKEFPKVTTVTRDEAATWLLQASSVMRQTDGEVNHSYRPPYRIQGRSAVIRNNYGRQAVYCLQMPLAQCT